MSIFQFSFDSVNSSMRQKGSALLVVLAFTGVITVLSIQMVTSQQLEDRITLRMKQKMLTQETTQSALVVAEAIIYQLPLGINEAPKPQSDLSTITTKVSNGVFFIWNKETLSSLLTSSTTLNNSNLSIGQQRDEWWETYGLPIDVLYEKLKTPVASRPTYITQKSTITPRFIIEEIGQNIDISQSTPSGLKVYYRITAHTGYGEARSTMQVIRDSTFIY